MHLSPDRRFSVLPALAGVAALALTFFAPAGAAHAQFGTASILRPRQQAGAERARPNSLIVGPSMVLGINSEVGVARTVGAGLIAYERGLSLQGDAALQVGGYVWANEAGSLLQAQVKYYPARSFGVQGAVLRGSDGATKGSAFALYNLSSTTRDPQAKVPWDVQFGLGGLFGSDDSGDDRPGASGFAQLSVGLSSALSLDLAYWVVSAERNSSINRFQAALGFKF